MSRNEAVEGVVFSLFFVGILLETSYRSLNY